MAANKNFDDFLLLFGNPGRCQLLCGVVILLIAIQAAFVQQFSIVTSYVPDHECKIKSKWTDNESLPLVGQCSIKVASSINNSNNVPCPNGWEYFTEKGEIYPSNEFDLVCEREYLFRFTLSIPYIGVMISGVVFGALSDKFGRKGLLKILLPILTVLNVALSFTPNLETFIVFLFVNAAIAQGIYPSFYSFTSELFQRRLRTRMNLFYLFLTAFTLPIQMYGMYFLLNWRTIHLVRALLTLPLLIPIWIIPESVTWLLSKGKVKQSEKILIRFAKCNKIQIPPQLTENLEGYSHDIQKQYCKSESMFAQMIKLYTNSAMRRITISIMFIAFTSNCVASALSFSISILDGNLYENYLINAGIQICLICAALIMFSNFGRVTVLTIHFLLAGLFGAGGYILLYYNTGSQILQVASTGMALIARNLLQTTSFMLMIFSTELFPTSLRSTGLGIASTIGRFGSFISPQILYTLNHFWQPLPHILFGVLCVLAAVVIIFLPETYHRSMPNSIEDVEKFMKNKKLQITETTFLLQKQFI